MNGTQHIAKHTSLVIRANCLRIAKTSILTPFRQCLDVDGIRQNHTIKIFTRWISRCSLKNDGNIRLYVM
ncbi:MAG: hypothetical protein N6V49_07630 [Serratia symbiotica]|nr:hypothetical protein [Serratia symbiotica]